MNKVIFDLNEWIPPGGEDAISFRSHPTGHVEISFDYERDDSSHSIRLVFDAAFYFVNQPFPGPNILNSAIGTKDIGFLELAEISASGLTRQCIDSWKQHASATYVPDFRHYFIYSYEMNQLFHVVAKSVAIEYDEAP